MEIAPAFTESLLALPVIFPPPFNLLKTPKPGISHLLQMKHSLSLQIPKSPWWPSPSFISTHTAVRCSENQTHTKINHFQSIIYSNQNIQMAANKVCDVGRKTPPHQLQPWLLFQLPAVFGVAGFLWKDLRCLTARGHLESSSQASAVPQLSECHRSMLRS